MAATEPLSSFLERVAAGGQVVPFELALRYMREQGGLPPPEAAPVPPARSATAEPPPLVPAGGEGRPVPRSLVPGVPADPRVLYGSFANPSPPPGSVLRYFDADNFGWAPASAGVVAVATPASGATVIFIVTSIRLACATPCQRRVFADKIIDMVAPRQSLWQRFHLVSALACALVAPCLHRERGNRLSERAGIQGLPFNEN